MNKNNPHIAQKFPYKIEVEKEKTYFMCSCGYSQNQPFCDGSHKDKSSGYKPIKYQAEKNDIIYFCGCKYSKNMPFCDGSHKNV